VKEKYRHFLSLERGESERWLKEESAFMEGYPENKQFRTADKCVLSAWTLGEGRKMPHRNKPARFDVLCKASDFDDSLG